MKTHDYSIKKLYFIFIIVYSLVTGFIVFAFEFNRELRQTNQRIENSLRQQGIIYQGILADFLRREDLGQINRLLSSLSASDYFLNSWISDENGIIIESSKSSNMGLNQAELLKNYGILPNYDKKQNIFNSKKYSLSRYPVTLGVSKGYIAANREGEFWAAYEVSELRKSLIKEHIVETLYLSGIMMLIFILFFGVIYKSVIVRLLHLTKSSRDFALGNHSVSFDLKGSDEIAVLGKSLEIMARTIQTDQQRLLEDEKKISQYVDIIDRNVITSKTDRRGVITYVSDAFSTISGYQKDEMVGKNHNLVRHPDTPKETFKDLWKTIKSGRQWEGELKNKKKDGSFYWVYARITPTVDSDGNIIEYTAVRQDITDQKKLEEIAITDELTKLYNRRFFNETIRLEYHRSLRNKRPFAFLIFDVDFFKLYNDTYGHLAGDKVLQQIGSLLNQMFHRSGDFAFRLGGEEFGVLMEIENIEKCEQECQKILQGVENMHIEHLKNKVSGFVTVSIGLVFVNHERSALQTDEIYRIADEALYYSKENGRNRYKITQT